MNKTSTIIEIPKPNIQEITVTIRGTAPLIFHKFSEKAKKMMLDKQLKKAKIGREARDPESEYKESYYYDEDNNIAFPAINIKQAMVGAARNVEGVTMALLRGALFVKGSPENGLIPVKYEKEEMREDVVRVGMGSADLRFRGQLTGWSMKVTIQYNADVLSGSQVVNLLQLAGFACGIGEWRPEKNGDKGTFEIES